MHIFDLYSIAERTIELINPTSPEKVLKVGRILGLKPGQRVIEFGCGFGEILALWGEQFGVGGIGIDIREDACERARRKLAGRGLADKFEIVCGKGADYPFDRHTFDVAACIGATFIWDGGYRETIRAIKEATRDGGKLVIGEVFWLTSQVPPGFVRAQGFHTEHELLQVTREEGFDWEYVVRASRDDWDRYEADNWHGLLRWIGENPDHPDRQQVVDWLHANQDEYTLYGREYLGWAMYVLIPIRDFS